VVKGGNDVCAVHWVTNLQLHKGVESAMTGTWLLLLLLLLLVVVVTTISAGAGGGSTA
jgi:hypothetical protein